MRDLRNHPLILAVEVVLLAGIGAVLFAHVEWRDILATAPRAFHTPMAEGALLERLSLRGAVYVNAEFHHRGRLHVDAEGVESVVVDESSPARMFRLHPADRRESFERTPGPDFFLDDPYVAPYEIAGGAWRDLHVPGGSELIKLGDDALDRVFVIDGNLWVHSLESLEVRLLAGKRRASVTFVVRGDIYFLDDVRAHEAGSSIAFIALPRVGFRGDGGDIWLGDVAYGTLSHIDGYLFAARDIHGALFGDGLVVNGALAAGGRIQIDEGRGCRRAPLVVRHDERYAAGRFLPPGL